MPTIEHILVAGGAGFVGQNLVRALLRRYPNTQVTVIDNGNHPTVNLLPSETNQCVWHRRDIRRRKDIESLFEVASFDVVINLAAHSGVVDSINNPNANFEVNVVGNFNLLDLARTNNVRRYLFSSTGGAIIGDGKPPLTEDMEANPLSPYGVSKLVGELYASIFDRCYDMNTCCLRFSNVYGEYSAHKQNLIPMFIKSALEGTQANLFGNGAQERDFIYVGDLVEGICRVLECESDGVLQLATGRHTSVNNLVSILGDLLPEEYILNWEHQPARLGEVYQTWCDNTKSVSLLGNYVSTSLVEGLRQTIDWYIQHHCPEEAD